MKNNNEIEKHNQKHLSQHESPVELSCDTYAGTVHIEWDTQAPVTPIGQLVFFIQFLKSCDLFSSWVQACPLTIRGYCYDPLLDEKWILDIDTTVKVLYGHQEGAEIGYNPKKPGRPAHIIHTYMMSETRLILDCEVMPGKQSAASYSLPWLIDFLEKNPKNKWPTLVRGDCAFGNDPFLKTL